MQVLLAGLLFLTCVSFKDCEDAIFLQGSLLAPVVTLLGCLLPSMSHLALAHQGLPLVPTPVVPLMYGLLVIGIVPAPIHGNSSRQCFLKDRVDRFISFHQSLALYRRNRSESGHSRGDHGSSRQSRSS